MDSRKLIKYDPCLLPTDGEKNCTEAQALELMGRLATRRGPQVEGRSCLAPGGRLAQGKAVVDGGEALPTSWAEVVEVGPREMAELVAEGQGHMVCFFPSDVRVGRPTLTWEGGISRTVDIVESQHLRMDPFTTQYNHLSPAPGAPVRWVNSSSTRFIFVEQKTWGAEPQWVVRWKTQEPSRFVTALLATCGL